MAWIIDLDGVVWLGTQAIPGSADAIDRLRRRGDEVVFATNNAYSTVAEHEAQLARFGIDARGAVISSAMATATMLTPGERVLVVGGPGLREAVEGRGCVMVDDVACDVVVCGLDRELRYESLRTAGLAIRAGARFVLTNPDATYPTPHGLEPGAGAIGAALTVAGGVEPEIGGKPHGAMVGMIRERFGADGVMVGDRLDTDGAFAAALGYRFALVLSGVTTAAEVPTDAPPWRVAADLAAVVALDD